MSCTIRLLVAALAAFLPRAIADCPSLPGCDALGPPPIGNPGGLDPKDPNAYAVYALNCPCYVGEVLDCTVTYTGIDGGTTTETTKTTVSYANTESTIIYSFTGAATSIQSGSPISIQFGARGANYPFVSQIYSPVPSIFYVESTTTQTQTVTATSTVTTTTSTTTTSTIPQQTSTSDCITGTQTNTAPAVTITLTSTITPKPTTRTVKKVVTTTKHAKCVPCGHYGYRRESPNERRNELVARQAPLVAETLWFPDAYGPPSSTYITTGITIVSETTTSTEVDTTTVTETGQTLATPTPATTTVCNNVGVTTTTTAKVTTTLRTTLKPRTITKTTTSTLTRTSYPYRPPVCTVRPKSPSLYGHRTVVRVVNLVGGL